MAIERIRRYRWDMDTITEKVGEKDFGWPVRRNSRSRSIQDSTLTVLDDDRIGIAIFTKDNKVEYHIFEKETINQAPDVLFPVSPFRRRILGQKDKFIWKPSPAEKPQK